MSHSVRRHLDVEIEAYDAAIRRWIPGYEAMIARAAEAVSAAAPALVLDLGAGTGALSEAILAHDTVGRVELLDVDETMLARARTRLHAFGDRARFVVRSFSDPLPSCDAVTASLALHHVPTMEAKAELFARIHRALRPGGVFANADVTVPADPEGSAAAYRAWAEHMGRSGISAEEAHGHFRAWSAEDTYFPLEDELAALEAAGFEARCVWRDPPSTVVVARKP